MTRGPALRGWLIGLALFALVILLSTALQRASAYGIVEHQLAGTAQRVNEIQQAWRADGVRWLAILAMLADLVFIGVYGWGSWIAGRSFMAMRRKRLQWLGAFVAAAAAVFLLTDYAETVLQIIQLIRDQGSDAMAQTAASMQQVKLASLVVTVVGVIAGLLVRRFSAPDA
jgi:hypothetical protein